MSSPKAGSEAALVRAVIDWIRDQPGGMAVKTHGSQFSSAGEPDITACINGRAIFLEAKRPGGKPTPIQMAAMRRWEKAGAVVGWFTSIEQAKEIMSHDRNLAWVNPQLH